MRVVRLATFCLVVALAGCADDPAPGTASTCDTPGGPLLGCPPPSATPEAVTIEDACWRLVECGVIQANQTNDQGQHFGDYTICLENLRGDDVSTDRLAFVLRCIDVSTCQDLAAGHCVAFGGEAPQ
jgi:hypothetical protein